MLGIPKDFKIDKRKQRENKGRLAFIFLITITSVETL